MSATYTSLYFHLVFATKHRQSLIVDAWKDRLHEYLGGLVKGQKAKPLGIGGMPDHVHLLVGLKPTHRLSDVMREIKKESTNWIHREFQLFNFAWQEGYSAFTVSPSARKPVKNYIANQEHHHKIQDSREELRSLLKRAGIRYDEKYFE